MIIFDCNNEERRKLTRVYSKNNLSEADKGIARKRYDELGLKDNLSLDTFQEIDYVIRQICLDSKTILSWLF